MLAELSVTAGRSKPFQTFVERLFFFGSKTVQLRERETLFLTYLVQVSVNIV